nr:alpha-fetoprotein-like [Pogona vitticeps]
MKWVTFTCLLLLSLAESDPLTEKAETVSLYDTTFSSFQELTEIVGLFYSQTIQKATYEELTKITHGVTELAKKCTVDKEADSECAKPLETLLFDQCCREEGLAEKYGFTECCDKANVERKECFLSLKNTSQNFLPPFEEPPVEQRCKALHEDAAATLGLYIYEVGRRFPVSRISMLLDFIHIYEKVMTNCCQKDDGNVCFDEKTPPVAQSFTEVYQEEKHICSILESFGKRGIHALKFAELSQQFPKANVATIDKLAMDITQAQEHCCKGHTLECYLQEVNLTTYVCSHQADISSKIKACCGKSMLEQATCFPAVENDDKPANLSPTLREFMDNEQLCPRYAEDRNPLLAEFVYEYGRRHSEYSPQMLLRLGEEYEDWLEKCCKAENRQECLVQAEEHLKKYIADTYNVTKESCDLYKRLGDDAFQNYFILQYLPKLPQISFEEMSRLAKTVSAATAKCCKMDDAHLLICAEEYGDLVIGMICQQHKGHPINKQVEKCCEDSYVYRIPCFDGLGVDPEYVPLPYDPKLFTLHGDFCSAKPEDQQKQKQRFLYNLVKQKPTITYGQLTPAIMDLTDVLTKCCGADNHEECFTMEGPKLIERTQAALGDN